MPTQCATAFYITTIVGLRLKFKFKSIPKKLKNNLVQARCHRPLLPPVPPCNILFNPASFLSRVVIYERPHTHPTYNTALFQYGRVSILSDSACTQSMKKQQQGASQTITTNPANICQMPAITQPTLNVKIPVQLSRPRMMATEINKQF